MVKEVLIAPLFEQFIKETKTGKRRKLNGELIKPLSIEQYEASLKLLKEYERHKCEALRIRVNLGNDQKQILRERNYWKKFYRNFSDFLLRTKGFYDNYVGSNFKNLKCFFRYLKNEKCFAIHDWCQLFYVKKEAIRIISLLPQQFCFLVVDKEFNEKLSAPQRKCKNLFCFGCIAALRYSDLMHLRVKDVELICGVYYLVFRSVKTNTPVSVKLPEFAVDIYKSFSKNKKPLQRLFPKLADANFNKHLKAIGEKAGWTEIIGKTRCKNGRPEEIKKDGKDVFRFCDQLSSHLMRKTGITILLMLGMPEFLVRKISGHSAHSKEFFRYVNFAQSFITDEIDKVHQKLIGLYH